MRRTLCPPTPDGLSGRHTPEGADGQSVPLGVSAVRPCSKDSNDRGKVSAPLSALPGGCPPSPDRCPDCPAGLSAPVLPAWMPPGAACHPGCRWLDLAAGLLGLGYAPVPLGPEKRPLVKWAAFHVEAPGSRELFADWLPVWPEARGVAVVTGRPHGLVVVDADDAESWAWALEALPAVRGVKTRRGGHLHFRHPARRVVGNRSGERAVSPAPGVRLDVKGLGGLATGPYSIHPSGAVYEPLGDWTRPVEELPVLPDVVARQAIDIAPARPRPRPPRPEPATSDPERALSAYLAKAGGIPEEGAGSDDAVFRAAAWAKANVPELSEAAFVAGIRRERPEFTEQWVGAKWRSARGR